MTNLITGANYTTFVGYYEINDVYEVYLPGGLNNGNVLFNKIGSTARELILGDLVLSIESIPHPNLFPPEQHWASAYVGHCVANGICETLRRRLRKVKSNSGRWKLNKKIKTVRQWFDTNYTKDGKPIGIPHDALQRFCAEHKIHIRLQQPTCFRVVDFRDPNANALYRFNFINLTKNHVELLYQEDELDEIILDDVEFHQALREQRADIALKVFCLPPVYKTLAAFSTDGQVYVLDKYQNDLQTFETEYGQVDHPIVLSKAEFVAELHARGPQTVKRHHINEEHHRQIYAFQTITKRYVWDTYAHRLVTTKKLGKLMLSVSQYFIDSRAPYYNLIRRAARAPCHVFSDKIFVKEPEVVDYPTETQCQFIDNLSHTDMHRCYRQDKLSKYYMGYPTKPSNFEYDVPYEKAKDLAGWWMIETEDTLPFAPCLSDVWTTPDLRFFKDQGVNFTIIFGCWDSNPLYEIPIPDDKAQYCIFSGLLTRERSSETSRWIDDTGLLENKGKGKIILQRIEKDYWRSGVNLSGYLYAYARTQIWEQAIQHDALGITVDALITKEPLEIPGTAHDGHPLWTTSPFTQRYTDYRAPSEHYCSGFNDRMREKYPIQLPEDVLGLEHVIGQEGNYLLTGAGGTGKSYATIKSLGWLAPTYVAPRLHLLDSKRNEGWFELVTERSFPVDRNSGYSAKGYLKRDIPKIVFLDEIGLMGGSDFDKCVEKCCEYGIRMIMAGDEVQNEDRNTPKDIWERARALCDHHLEFTIDRRSKDEKIRKTKVEIRKLGQQFIRDPSTIDRVIEDMRGWLSYAHRPNLEQRENLPYIKLYNHDETKHGPLPKGGSRTIDTVQGMTITTPTICVINGNTRRDQLPKLIYTMISRFCRYSDMYISDTTNLSKPETISLQF